MGQSPRPLIGINVDLATSRAATTFVRLPVGYVDAVFASGGLPVLLPPLNKQDELESLLDKVDGVVLVGGLDMDPRRQGLPGHPALVPMAERREESDRILVKLLLDRRMPVLGIGLGMQQVNVALGGSLFLHLPEENPKAMPHYDPTGSPHRHTVMLEPRSRIEEIYGGGELRVNSTHHQAVKTLGTGLRVGATAPDGVVEAIESVDSSWFFVGVQWHPEAETASALDLQLFECFVQACCRESNVLQMAA